MTYKMQSTREDGSRYPYGECPVCGTRLGQQHGDSCGWLPTTWRDPNSDCPECYVECGETHADDCGWSGGESIPAWELNGGRFA